MNMSMKIRSLIIDDELNNVEYLRTLLNNHFPEVEVVGGVLSANEGIEMIRIHQPELVFLDVQMPGASGFEVLKAFSSIDFEIIFVTAYSEYGIQAIKFSALDYLLKPIDLVDFKAAMIKAKEKIGTKKQNQNIENLLEYIRAEKQEAPKIALPTLTEILYVKVTHIIRCEADSSYTNFFIANNDPVTVCKTLKEFAELLRPYDFIRTHQSHLVNLHVVKSYLKEDGGVLLLNDRTKVPISRQNRDYVRNELNKRLLV